MQRHPPEFAALGLADMQQTLFKIDVRALQRRGFTGSQSRCRNEAEDRGATHAAQAPGRWQRLRGLEQCVDLLIGINMGCETSAALRTEESERRDLGGRIEPQAI